MIPGLIDIGAKRRVLPPGRYSCALEEVRDRFVPDGDENRMVIWDAFLATLELIRATVGSLAEVWIGGSFITGEESPRDIDVVFLFREDRIKALGGEGAFVARVLARQQLSPRVDRLNEYVDGYLLVVPPTKTDNNLSNPYTRNRGYWDQFWSKTRFGDDDVRWHYPAAGYLEVMIDGYGD